MALIVNARNFDSELDGSTVNITIATAIIPVIKASYGDKLEYEFVTSMGSQSQDADTPGKYSTSDVKFTIRSSVARAVLLPALQAANGNSVNGLGNVRVVGTINYIHPTLGTDFDRLIGLRFIDLAAALEVGSKALEIEIGAKCRQCLWTSRGYTLNRLSGLGLVRA